MQLSPEDFSQLVAQAIESVPPAFKPYLQDIVIDVEDQPSPEACRELGLDDPGQLLGLYRGSPLTRRHVDAPYRYPERIILYQNNIQRICRSRPAIVRQIRKTVLHEIGHHFGLNEAQLRELGYG